MTAPLLQTTAVAKAFGPVVALRAVDLTVHPGESHALLGANGAGKSTMVKILTGVLRADAGTIALHGRPTELRRPSDAQAAGLAPVFQDPALAPDLTVAQNLRLSGADVGAVRAELAAMGLDGLDLDEQVRDLPLPFLRMLDLARALAFDPQLLVLDEITAALPARPVRARLRRDAAVEGAQPLGAVHLPPPGRGARPLRHVHGPARRPRRGVVRPRRGRRGADRVGDARRGGDRRPGRGADPRRRPSPTGARPVLEAEHVGAGRQLEDVSLAVAPGEVLGLVALEGQGQETLFDILAGNLKADRGRLLIDGQPVKARHPFDVIRKGVVLVPADRLHALLPQRSIRENIAAPLFNRVAKWGPINGREERRRVQEAVDRLSIDTRAASQVRRLSGGNQQKVTIARWLARGLRVMLLFDPTRGIDVGTKHQVYDLVRALADEGAAIVMFTSELREVAMVCDRSAVLHNGRIVAELPADAGENALLSAAHGLEVAA